MLDEGFDSTSSAEGTRGHHQQLVLLYSLEEGPHVGFDCLYRNVKVILRIKKCIQNYKILF